MKKNLEQYLKDNIKRNIIDHSIRASTDQFGTISFYIHPANTDGDTLDFVVRQNNLVQLVFDS